MIDAILVQRITYDDKVDLEETSRELVSFSFGAATRPPPRGSKRPR